MLKEDNPDTMSSHSRKPKFTQEICGQGKSHVIPKHSELTSTGRDIEEKPFPIKPVCPKRLVKSTTHNLNLEKKSEDVPNSTSLGKGRSRLLAGELQMTKEIQEKQLALQKKLQKVEDALREKIQRDNVDVNVYGGNQTVKKKHYERRQETVNPDSKTQQRTEMRSNEMTERHNPKQYKFKQDTITKKTEQWRETVTTRKEESSEKYVKSEQTQSQQKTSRRLAIGDKDIAGKTLHEELNLPQVSSTLSCMHELESTDKNIKVLPCSICKCNFKQDRLEKHMQICEKVKKTKQPVFGNQTVKKKHYERLQETVNPDSKTKQRTEVRSNEMTERHNPKQYKFKQDTITKKTEQWRETVTTRKEESSEKYVKREQTQSQQKTSRRLSIGDKDIAGKTLHEELNLPQVSSTLSCMHELESTDKNIKVLPCSFCQRNFKQDRLEKHMQICEKVKKTRPVLLTKYYTGGFRKESAVEFWKTKGRNRTPEVSRKKKQSQYNKT